MSERTENLKKLCSAAQCHSALTQEKAENLTRQLFKHLESVQELVSSLFSLQNPEFTDHDDEHVLNIGRGKKKRPKLVGNAFELGEHPDHEYVIYMRVEKSKDLLQVRIKN